MGSDLEEAKRRIDRILAGYQRAAGLRPQRMLSPGVEAGKVYELWVLCELLERLHRDEGYRVVLNGGSKVTLKSSPGPVNPSFPHFELHRGGRRLHVWTDVEFLALSHSHRGSPPPAPGDYHELDIAVLKRDAPGRPSHDEVLLGVECKHTGFRKDLLRTVLGVRRELSLLSPPEPTPFRHWPRAEVPANPPSCLLVYCSSPSVRQYDSPGETFGIDFFFKPLP